MTLPEDEAVAQEESPPEQPLEASLPEEAPATGRPLRAIAGIGASAGGLEALEAFFARAQPGTGIAYVVVMHLDPSQKGRLPELLARVTPLAVREIQDGDELEPDTVYVKPSGADILLIEGRFSLVEPPSDRRPAMTIDAFFSALATDQDGRAVGIVLSGAGTDGALGVRALKERTGMVMVQEPSTAQFDGMPSSAIATGLADYIAAPDELPRLLVEYVRYFTDQTARPLTADEQFQKALDKVFVLIRSRTGQDFTKYKQSTIRRRIERRMAVHQLLQIDDYVRYLQENPREVDVLARELLIGVTRFFRDPEAWMALMREALPPLLLEKSAGSTVRAWSVGCSTGEEAYTLAIVLREALVASGRLGEVAIQVFGTDVDADAIATARQGLYPENIAADVPADLLERYFLREDGRYRVRPEIRESVVFAPQNVILDAPFTHLDLVVCRNLLIYLTPELQQRLLPLFHYALEAGGLLFLGTAESIGAFHNLFRTRDGRWKIYQRRGVGTVPVPIGLEGPATVLRRGAAAAPPVSHDLQVASIAQDWLVGQYAPPSVVTNEVGEILFFHGRTGRYLEPGPGRANLNIHVMARPPLREALDAAFGAAVQQRRSVTSASVPLAPGGPSIRITVRPISRPSGRSSLYGVSFEEAPAPDEEPAPGAEQAEPAAPRAAEELEWTRSRLQRTIEDGQASQEELKSMNEELQSMNEELQSTNEELTTSKEELQSLNEELMTVNTELQNKVEEVSRTHDDMQNLLRSTEIAILFLDNDLRVRRFTPPMAQIIRLRQGDVGRPITDFMVNIRDSHLIEKLREVLETLQAREEQVQTAEGRWYLMRALPYRTAEDRIAGVVVTFVDITPIRELEASVRDARAMARAVVDLIPGPALLIDGGAARVANNSFTEAFGAGPGQGEPLPEWLGAPLRTLQPGAGGEVEVAPPGGGSRRAVVHPLPGGLTLVTFDGAGPPGGAG